MMVLVLGDDFEFSLVSIDNYFGNVCTNSDFSALVPCFIDHLFLVSDFRQLPCRDFLQFFPIPCLLLPLRLESTLLGVKDILHVLSVSRGKRL